MPGEVAAVSLLSPGDIAGMHEALVELSNATLTAIEAPGTIGLNGDPSVGAPMWTGAAPGFLLRAEKDILSGGVEVSEPVTTLRVFDEAGAAVAALRAGSDWTAATVVIADHRLGTVSTRRWTVIAMEHEADQTLNSVLLTLNADTAVT